MPLARVSQFRNRANVGLLALAFGVILVTSFVSVKSIDELRASIAWISHTVQVKDRLAVLQNAMGGMEADGLRYMIVGDDGHLAGMHRHLDEIRAGIRALKAMTTDNPAHQRALAGLGDDYDLLMRRVEASVAIKRADLRKGDEMAAIRRVRDGKGEAIVDRMHARIEEMAAQEDRLLADRRAERDSLVKQTNATLLIANGLALFAGLLGFFALRRAQREAENTLLVELHAAQARRASEEKSVFLASMSHEIRTPMNAIFGFAQLLADQIRESLHREWVASIRKSGQMLLALINDVLDLSKIEAGKLQLNPQGTDIAELTGEIVALFEPMAEAKRLTLRSEIDETELVPVAIDAQRLRQILMNLISNAVKYTERGEVVVSVTMRPAPLGDGRDLRLTVRDTGTGIAPEAQAQIFEPFFQADSPDGRHRQGTGLGLSITRRLVDLMRGNIQLGSRVGEGTTFQVTLPDLSPAIPVAATGAGDVEERADFDRLPPLRILIVDDVEWNIEVARGYLHGSRHVVAVARDGEQAVAMAESFRPDAVMMDLRMPRMNGYRATEAIRDHPALRHVRVIAVTASSLVDEYGAQRVPFDGYIRKPYAPTELLNVLLSLFGEAATPEIEVDAVASGDAAAHGGAARDVALAEWHAIRAMSLDPLRRRMRIREIGEFSRRLNVLAEDIGDAVLVEEARRLHVAVQRFDAHQMKAVLDRLAGDAGEIAQEMPEDALRFQSPVTLPVVMVVDDQSANVQVVGQLLTHADYDVVPVLDGREALALAERSPPDLVLLDMRMPGLDGFAVLEGLQALPQTRDVPVVFLTADHERDSLVRAFSSGAVDYITKPFIAEELLARVRTHLDLKRSRERLSRMAEERQRMAEIVSHDLRNHFGNILFSADMLREDDLPDDARRALASSIRESADAGVLFLQAFLEQQHDQAHGVPVKPMLATDLAGRAIRLLAAQAAHKRIALQLVPEDPDLLVMAEEAGAGHVLQNLLSNAIKYSPPDSQVAVSVARRGKFGALMVHDRGPGISAQDRENLFKRFVRLSSKPTGGESATGLGLALAKQRARTMGGDLWYEDRPGGGATFVFELALA